MKLEGIKSTKKDMRGVIIISACCCLLVLALVLALNIKNSQDQYEILEDSVESQLIATSLAAREFIDIDDFVSYNSTEDAEADGSDYDKTLAQLRQLCTSVGAEYIYALKEIDGKYYFVFDTDTEDEAIFIEYELSPVHEQAFEGKEAVGIMNVDDEFGSYNTGAVPLYDGDEIVGIISVDINDVYITESRNSALFNMVILVAALVVTLIVMFTLIIVLLKRVNKMQGKLQHLAHHDVITGLPNRQYLMEYLNELTTTKKNEPFALFFIDLDNFKKVNDNAGHDAGDELLRHIAEYLDSSTNKSKSFRPAAGRLNIAARVGGDEFIQVVSEVSNAEEAAVVAQDLLANFETKKLSRFIEKYNVGLSIGVALYPYHTEDYNVLIKYADTAMYEAKHSGKNNYSIYTDEMSQ